MTTKASACHLPDCRGFFRSLLGWDAGLGRKSGPLRSGPKNACLWREGVLSEQKRRVAAPPRASKPSINRWGQFHVPYGGADARILSSRWRPQRVGAGLFERLHEQLGGDAWLVGRVTRQEFANGEPCPAHADQPYPRGAWFAPAMRLKGQPRGCPGGSRSATGCRTGSRCGQISASRLYTSGRNCNVPSLSTNAVW